MSQRKQRHDQRADDWRQRSLEELEGPWPDDAPTPMVSKVLRARRIPLERLDRSQVRLLLAQKVGVRFVVPLALELLARSPLIECDFYPGDLLEALVRIPDQEPALPDDFRDRLRRALISALDARVPVLLPALRREFEARVRELG